MDLFRALLATEKPEIVGITETWIHTNTRDFEGEFEIPGYKTFKKDRLDREGGGVMLYVRGHLDPVECKIETEHEMVGVVLNKLEKKLHFFRQNTYLQNKKHMLTCQGGTGCYRFNYQPGS